MCIQACWHWLIGPLAGWLAGWLIGRSIDQSIDKWINWWLTELANDKSVRAVWMTGVSRSDESKQSVSWHKSHAHSTVDSWVFPVIIIRDVSFVLYSKSSYSCVSVFFDSQYISLKLSILSLRISWVAFSTLALLYQVRSAVCCFWQPTDSIEAVKALLICLLSSVDICYAPPPLVEDIMHWWPLSECTSVCLSVCLTRAWQ